MKMRIRDVAEWFEDRIEEESVLSHGSKGDFLALLSSEEISKREELNWWDEFVRESEIVLEGEDEDEILEIFNNTYCEYDLLKAAELDGEVIDEAEGEED